MKYLTLKINNIIKNKKMKEFNQKKQFQINEELVARIRKVKRA